jgi:hypothetical protein
MSVLTKRQLNTIYCESPSVIVSEKVNVDELIDNDSLNPLNRKKIIEEVSNFLCDDVAYIVSSYIDGRE